MGKEHKKHKKHKRSKHEHRPKNGERYHVPVVPLKTAAPCAKPAERATQSVARTNDPIGPVRPPGLSNAVGSEPGDARDGGVNDSYGPSLPPRLVQQRRAPGPSLPSDFKIDDKPEPADDGTSGIGPLPAELVPLDSEQLFVQKQLELRAEYMKRKFAGEVSFFFFFSLAGQVPFFDLLKPML